MRWDMSMGHTVDFILLFEFRYRLATPTVHLTNKYEIFIATAYLSNKFKNPILPVILS